MSVGRNMPIAAFLRMVKRELQASRKAFPREARTPRGTTVYVMRIYSMLDESAPAIRFPPGRVVYTFDPPLELPPLLLWMLKPQLLTQVSRLAKLCATGGKLSLELEFEGGETLVVHTNDKRGYAIVFSLWLTLKQRGIDFLRDLLEEGRRSRERLARLVGAAGKVKLLALLTG
ncbi:MAG: hypothetical protein QXT28_08375 [Thermofilaceae archaeon]